MSEMLKDFSHLINFAPVFNNSPVFNNTNESKAESTSTATATVENNISIEIKTLINGLQGDYNALKGALNKDLGGTDENCEIADEALNELDQCKDEDEIVKKGVLSKLEYFIEQALDKTTKIGAIIDKSRFAFAQLKKIVEKFAKIAVKVYGKVAPIAPIILNFIEQNGINIPGL
jgi:L-lactate utilization protein LutB